MILTLTLTRGGRGEPWQVSAETGVVQNQAAYSDNWEGGEAGSFTWTMHANLAAQKPLSRYFHLRNSLKLYFGQTHSQDTESKEWRQPQKSTDRIELESTLRMPRKVNIDPFASVRLESQFLDASDLLNERYFNPVTVTESVGASRALFKKEKREWTARMGVGFRQVVDRDRADEENPVRKLTRVSRDAGLEAVTRVRTSLTGSRLSWEARLIFFQALVSSQAGELQGEKGANYWRAPDLNLESTLTANITEVLMVSLYLQWLYDREISAEGRFKQTLSFGLTYNLM